MSQCSGIVEVHQYLGAFDSRQRPGELRLAGRQLSQHRTLFSFTQEIARWIIHQGEISAKLRRVVPVAHWISFRLGPFPQAMSRRRVLPPFALPSTTAATESGAISVPSDESRVELGKSAWLTGWTMVT
jgi:hypothetical protein